MLALLVAAAAETRGERSGADPPRGGLAALGAHGDAAVTIGGVSAPPHRRLTPIEVELEVSGSWVNPFDPEDVRVWLEIDPPDGSPVRVDAFVGAEHQRTLLESGEERVARTGPPRWQARFTPTIVGSHTVRAIVDDGSGPVEAAETATLAVDHAAGRGFVRASAEQPRYLQHGDGSLYFPTGLNLAWPDRSGTFAYERVLPEIAARGGNTVRVWLGPGFHVLSLEDLDSDPDDINGGLGWINLDAAWRFDRVVELAEELELSVVPVMFSFGGFRQSKPGNWDLSPYSTVHGGPLESGGQFLTNEQAMSLAERRIRYAVARWGASPAIACWELWNEINGIDGYDSAASARWHERMARLIRRLDPHDRLITTSTWWPMGDPALDELDDIGLLMSHQYNSDDHAVTVYGIAVEKSERHAKPHLIGEYGNQEFDRTDSGRYQPERVAVHNVMWASLAGGSAGGGLYWYWEIGERDGWARLLEPVAAFVRDIPLHRETFLPIQITPRRAGESNTRTSITRPEDGPLVIHGFPGSWRPVPANRPNVIPLDRNGNTSAPHLVPSHLQPERGGNAQFHNPPTFVASFRERGTFAVRVMGVSGQAGASMRIELNGEPVLERDFPDTDPDDPSMMETYNGDYTIAVPPGKHRIRVVNTSEDWIHASYVFDGVTDEASVPLWVTGRVRPDEAGPGEVAGFLWARHRDMNWRQRRESVAVTPVAGVEFVVTGLPRGDYVAEWFDTREAGAAIAEYRFRATPTGAVIPAPTIVETAAAKLRKLDSADRTDRSTPSSPRSMRRGGQQRTGADR